MKCRLDTRVRSGWHLFFLGERWVSIVSINSALIISASMTRSLTGVQVVKLGDVKVDASWSYG